MNETMPATAATALVEARKTLQHDADAERETRAETNPRKQIDPSDGFAQYRFLREGVVLAELVATLKADERSRMEEEREYWRIIGDGFNSSVNDHPITVEKVKCGAWSECHRPYTSAGHLFTAGVASFYCSVNVPWHDKAGTDCFHKPTNTDHGGLAVNVTFDPAKGCWTGTMSFFRSTRKLLFATMGRTRDLNRQSHKYTQWCEVSDFQGSRAPGIYSGDQVFLRDTERGADLCKARLRSRRCYFATHDQPGGPQAHKLTLVTPSADRITSGSKIYLQSIEQGDRYYLRRAGEKGDLYYGSTNLGESHIWIIKKPNRVDNEPIFPGDEVILLSKDGQHSMQCNPGDNGYLSVTDAGAPPRKWKII